MPDWDDVDDMLTRREVLGTSAAALASMAGCSGSGGDGETTTAGTTTTTSQASTTEETTTEETETTAAEQSSKGILSPDSFRQMPMIYVEDFEDTTDRVSQSYGDIVSSMLTGNAEIYDGFNDDWTINRSSQSYSDKGGVFVEGEWSKDEMISAVEDNIDEEDFSFDSEYKGFAIGESDNIWKKVAVSDGVAGAGIPSERAGVKNLLEALSSGHGIVEDGKANRVISELDGDLFGAGFNGASWETDGIYPNTGREYDIENAGLTEVFLLEDSSVTTEDVRDLATDYSYVSEENIGSIERDGDTVRVEYKGLTPRLKRLDMEVYMSTDEPS